MTPQEKAQQADEMAATISPSILALTVIDAVKFKREALDMIESLSKELYHHIEKQNAGILQNIKSTDLDDPDLYDHQSVHEAMEFINEHR